MEFNTEELGWINNALNEVLGGAYAIPDWEFSTLMGGSRQEVRALLARVNDEVSTRRRAEPQT